MADLAATAPEERRAKIAKLVSGFAGDILGFSGDIDQHRGLFELGFDSLSAIDFKTTLDEALCTELSSTLAFDYPSIDAIVGHLDDTIVPKLLAKASASSLRRL